MKESAPQIRAHRFRGLYCVLHSALIFVAFGVVSFNERLSELRWVQISCITFASLWFVWPIALLLHRGRSFLRVTVPLVFGYAIYFFWSAPYSRAIGGPERFGLSWGVNLTPHTIAWYAISYGKGWLDAKKDGAAGRLMLEAYGFGTFTPGAPNFSDEAVKQCGIEINHVTGCVVNTWILGHAQGYNEAMITKIKRRCPVVVKAAEDQDARWLQSYYDGEKAGRADAANDLHGGHLLLEISDPPKTADEAFERMLRERYQIGFKRVKPHADPKIANSVFGHANGYNEVVESEIERRFGKGTMQTIWNSFYENRRKD